MSVLMWSWEAAWPVSWLWLEWRVGGQWLPGTDDVREEWTRWSVPPLNALSRFAC